MKWREKRERQERGKRGWNDGIVVWLALIIIIRRSAMFVGGWRGSEREQERAREREIGRKVILLMGLGAGSCLH